MKPFHAAKRFGANVPAMYRNGCIGLLSLVPVLAMAQGTDPFDAAVTSILAKINLYWPQLIGIAVVAVGFGIGMKYIRKIRGAA